MSGVLEFDETATSTSDTDFLSVQTFGTVSSLSLTVTDGSSGTVSTLTPFISNAEILLSQNLFFGTIGQLDQLRIQNSNFTLRFLGSVGTVTYISSLLAIDQSLIDTFLANPGGAAALMESSAYAQFGGNTFAIDAATVTTPAAPLPAPALLLLAGLGALAGLRRRRTARAG